ncbi:MAG: MerR family transcriptional regulator [Lentisphaeria bacterium]|nr:MerR family transcriptional regulator [Lentisphaeria bacterium]
MNSRNYTVMELAEQINVPRTTINDWLNRYSQYIDSVVQGKRKVYPDSALVILKEIAALRNEGKAFADIETELSAKHPIRAVPVQPQEEIKKEDFSGIPSGEAVPESSPQPGSEAYAVTARQQSDEIGRLIGESFRSMEKRIQELENLSSAQRRISCFWLGICALFLLFLAGGTYLTMKFMKQAKQENLQLQRLQVENTAQLTALKAQSVSLNASNRTFQANIVRLESELQQQKKDFEQNIRSEKQRLAELHQAKEKALLSERDNALLKIKEQETLLALEKEKFASEQLKLLRELDDLKKQLSTRKTELAKPEAEKEMPLPEKKAVIPEKKNSDPPAVSAESVQPESSPVQPPKAGEKPAEEMKNNP